MRCCLLSSFSIFWRLHFWSPRSFPLYILVGDINHRPPLRLSPAFPFTMLLKLSILLDIHSSRLCSCASGCTTLLVINPHYSLHIFNAWLPLFLFSHAVPDILVLYVSPFSTLRHDCLSWRCCSLFFRTLSVSVSVCLFVIASYSPCSVWGFLLFSSPSTWPSVV